MDKGKFDVLAGICDQLAASLHTEAQYQAALIKVNAWEQHKKQTQVHDSILLVVFIMALVAAYHLASPLVDLVNHFADALFMNSEQPHFAHHGLASLLNPLFWLLAFVVIASSIVAAANYISTSLRYRGLTAPSFEEVELAKSGNIKHWLSAFQAGGGSFFYGTKILNAINNPLIFSELPQRRKLRSAMYFVLAEIGDADQCYELSKKAEQDGLSNEYYFALRQSKAKGGYKAALQLNDIENPQSSSSGWLLAGLALGIALV